MFFTSCRLVAVTLSALLVFAGVLPAGASSFLGRVQAQESEESSVLNFVGDLLSEVETMLHGEQRFFTETHIQSIAQAIGPTYDALPKNEFGKLGHASLNEALHRIFTERHGWFVKGIAPSAAQQAMDAADSTTSSGLGECLPQGIAKVFEGSAEDDGLGLFEIAILVITVEHLVHKEAVAKLYEAFEVHKLNTDEVLSVEEAEQVMDTYLTKFILGGLDTRDVAAGKKYIEGVRENVKEKYPPFKLMQKFLREVEHSITAVAARDSFYFSDAVNILEGVNNKFGHWQDSQCQDLKSALVSMEGKGDAGAGRVHLGNFYHARLHDGRWSFSESIAYLRRLGALDESDPERLRLIIPNYISGPSNCVGSSSYYSVCCTSECEGIMTSLEKALMAPEAAAEHIARMVESLPSSTTPMRQRLPDWLRGHLDEIAAKHDGLVPLRGRRFAHWMHLAYPRDCPYVPEARPLEEQSEESEKYEEKTGKEAGDVFMDFDATEEEMTTQIGALQRLGNEDYVRSNSGDQIFDAFGLPLLETDGKSDNSDSVVEADAPTEASMESTLRSLEKLDTANSQKKDEVKESESSSTFRNIMRYSMFVAALGAVGGKLIEQVQSCKVDLAPAVDFEKIKEHV